MALPNAVLGPFSNRFESDEQDDVLARVASLGTDAECWLPERILLRGWVIGRAYDLPLMSALEYGQDTTLNVPQASRLADEIEFVIEVTNDPLLSRHLMAVYAVVAGSRGNGVRVEWP